MPAYAQSAARRSQGIPPCGLPGEGITLLSAAVPLRITSMLSSPFQAPGNADANVRDLPRWNFSRHITTSRIRPETCVVSPVCEARDHRESGGPGRLPTRHPVPAASRAPRRSLRMTATPPVETILLVEDEPPLRRRIRRALEGQGYRVLEAPNAQHALVAAERHISDIDLLVTDVMLPDMNGFDLAYCLGGVMEVLVVTGQAEDHAGVRTGLAGTSFLRKPFSFDELQRSVRRVLHAGPLAA